MEIIDTTVHRSQLRISRDELRIMKAALNEICNGIEVPEFDTRIGADRYEVAGLLKEVGQLLEKMKSSAPR